MIKEELLPIRLHIGGLDVPESDRSKALSIIKKIYGNDVFCPGSKASTDRRIDMRCGHLPQALKEFRDSIGRLRLAV